MLAGITGPYLAYLKERDKQAHPLTVSRLILGFTMSTVYFLIVLGSIKIAKQYGKTPLGILVSNCLVFLTVTLVSLGVAFVLE